MAGTKQPIQDFKSNKIFVVITLLSYAFVTSICTADYRCFVLLL